MISQMHNKSYSLSNVSSTCVYIFLLYSTTKFLKLRSSFCPVVRTTSRASHVSHILNTLTDTKSNYSSSGSCTHSCYLFLFLVSHRNSLPTVSIPCTSFINNGPSCFKYLNLAVNFILDCMCYRPYTADVLHLTPYTQRFSFMMNRHIGINS